jgi:hypothetical protein
MIPAGLIGWALVALIRAAGSSSRTPGRRDPRTQNLVARFFLVCFGLVPIATGLAAVVDNRVFSWAIGALVVPMMFPAAFAGRVLVPLGLPKAAYFLVWVGMPPFYPPERRGAAAFFGALAALRARRVDPKTLDWLERRLLLETSPREATVAGAGLLAAARGKLDAARALLRSVDALPGHFGATAPQRVARSWLVADAARRGSWHEVGRLGLRCRPYRRWPHAMGLIAERLEGTPAARSDASLVLAWLVAPHRLATWPILRRALATPRTGPGVPGAESLASGVRDAEVSGVAAGADDLLRAALQAHATCIRAPSAASVAASAAAWDAVQASPQVSATLGQRALALSARTGAESALARLAGMAEADLAAFPDALVAVATPTGLARGSIHASARAAGKASDTLRRAARRVRANWQNDVETVADSLRERTVRGAALESYAEWLAWASLREPWERLRSAGSLADRRAVFALARPMACNYAVWLYNDQGEKLLANAIFRWLLDEANVLGDDAAAVLLKRNADAGSGP